MKTITLNETTTYDKGLTTKYWREVECGPQTVQMSTWTNGNPLFILSGIVVRSHDPKEIGQSMDVYCQMYEFALQRDVDAGIYTLN